MPAPQYLDDVAECIGLGVQPGRTPDVLSDRRALLVLFVHLRNRETMRPRQ